MPLNKTPQAAPAAAPVAAPATAAAPAEEAKPKRSLKAKVAPAAEAATEAAVESTAKAAATRIQPASLDDKSKQIQKQGVWQAVVQSNALVQYAPTLDAYLDLVDRAADRGLQYINSER